MKRPKILFVAMQNSIHTSRWINQISDQHWDIHLFPMDHHPVHPDLGQLTVHQPFLMDRPRQFADRLLGTPLRFLRRLGNLKREQLSHALHLLRRLGNPGREKHQHPQQPPRVLAINPQFAQATRPGENDTVRLGESDATAPALYGPEVLSQLVRKLKPDLIHSLEFQHCGYNVLRAKELYGDDFPPWLATNWGSDIYFYRQFEDHRRQIARLLASANYYSCECQRDVGLALELGFAGRVMPVMPNTGGLDLQL